MPVDRHRLPVLRLFLLRHAHTMRRNRGDVQ